MDGKITINSSSIGNYEKGDLACTILTPERKINASLLWPRGFAYLLSVVQSTRETILRAPQLHIYWQWKLYTVHGLARGLHLLLHIVRPRNGTCQLCVRGGRSRNSVPRLHHLPMPRAAGNASAGQTAGSVAHRHKAWQRRRCALGARAWLTDHGLARGGSGVCNPTSSNAPKAVVEALMNHAWRCLLHIATRVANAIRKVANCPPHQPVQRSIHRGRRVMNEWLEGGIVNDEPEKGEQSAHIVSFKRETTSLVQANEAPWRTFVARRKSKAKTFWKWSYWTYLCT